MGSAVRPTAMALTDRGIHFWYASPYKRHPEDGFVAWDEVKFIGVRGSGKSQWRAFERKNGVADDFGFLSAENWAKLREEWILRTPAPPAS